jgi:cyclic-di-GMP phosphodiesterase TipF (flagellum assembly factor)
MLNALIFAIYALACATAALGLMLTGFATPRETVVAGVVLLLLASQIHLLVLNRREAQVIRRRLGGLKRATDDFTRGLQDAQAKIEDVRASADARANEQSRKFLAELEMLEGLMREFSSRISESAKDVSMDAGEARTDAAPSERSARTYIEPDEPRDLLETIRASLEENRVDLYLQPIVSLPQRKLRYYEALSRLRAEDGTVIMPAQYMKIAAPVGLMSVVDNLLLFRCVQIVRRLVQRQRGVGVFCNISGETLSDEEFFPQFLEYMHHNRDLAAQIVFEFDQSVVLGADLRAEENLRYLASLGFALSMDHVETLALDFDRLKGLGFRHIKVRADTLAAGTGLDMSVPPEQLKAQLERHGLNLIAEHVETERAVVQLLDYAVDFAQGYLFGEPRPVREDSLKSLVSAEPPTER